MRAQNEALAKWVEEHPDRFVGMASVALQHPEQAAEQLEDGVKRLGLRGASIGGHVNGEDLSLAKYDPFWAKAAELGVWWSCIPAAPRTSSRTTRFGGRGDLGNVIGNPLETTYFLSRLIFDGVLDRFPACGLRRPCRRLPAVLSRAHGSGVRGAGQRRVRQQEAAERVLKSQLVVDTMVFSPEGLRHLVAEIGVGQIVTAPTCPSTGR